MVAINNVEDLIDKCEDDESAGDNFYVDDDDEIERHDVFEM